MAKNQQQQQQGNKLWNGIKRVGRGLRWLLKLVWKLVKLIGRALRGIWRAISRRRQKKQASQDGSSSSQS